RGYVRRTQREMPLLDQIYTAYAKNFTGMLLRDDKWWEQRVVKDKPHIAIAYNEENQPEGYVLYEVTANTFTVRDMTYVSRDGWRLLLQFIANHDSMIEQVKMSVPENDNLPLLADEPRFEQKIVPYFMARIVDVFTFLKDYPFQGGIHQAVTIQVEDDFFPENSGVYQISKHGEVTSVLSGSVKSGNGIHCTVQSLTMMLLGYKRPVELYQAGLIEGEQEQMEHLEQLIPEQQTFFADFF